MCRNRRKKNERNGFGPVLRAAMRIGRVEMMGRTHDGPCDAYNTARLFIKVQRQSAFQLELVPICEYADPVSHLSFSLGELFTSELLEQIEPIEEAEEKRLKNYQQKTGVSGEKYMAFLWAKMPPPMNAGTNCFLRRR